MQWLPGSVSMPLRHHRNDQELSSGSDGQNSIFTAKDRDVVLEKCIPSGRR